MAADDWYRNKEWNAEIETAFNEKLRRARRKEQYIRIQACILAPTYPNVALRLLDEYFKLEDDFDHAQAYVDRAMAYLALGQLDHAVKAYEAALTKESEGRGVRTVAYIDYPFLIVSNGLKELYEGCLTVLETHQKRLMFPLDHFKWHASRALVLSAQGKHTEAKKDACAALNAANKEHSGFRYHRNIGLVGRKYEDIQNKLENLCNA
jgi:tetratricopeptide (TPR) repeat protein